MKRYGKDPEYKKKVDEEKRERAKAERAADPPVTLFDIILPVAPFGIPGACFCALLNCRAHCKTHLTAGFMDRERLNILRVTARKHGLFKPLTQSNMHVSVRQQLTVGMDLWQSMTWARGLTSRQNTRRRVGWMKMPNLASRYAPCLPAVCPCRRRA